MFPEHVINRIKKASEVFKHIDYLMRIANTQR